MRATTNCSTLWPNIPSSSNGRLSSHRKARGWLVHWTGFARSCESRVVQSRARGPGSDRCAGRLWTENSRLPVDLDDDHDRDSDDDDGSTCTVYAVPERQRDKR